MPDAALRHTKGPKVSTAVPGWRANREQLAWAAGFFDGEGYLHFSMRLNGDRTHRRWRRMDLQINQTHPEVLERFRDSVGLGCIGGPYWSEKRPTKNPHWMLHINGYHQVQAAVARLWPFLSSVKRDQVHNALLAYRLGGGSNS